MGACMAEARNHRSSLDAANCAVFRNDTTDSPDYLKPTAIGAVLMYSPGLIPGTHM